MKFRVQSKHIIVEKENLVSSREPFITTLLEKIWRRSDTDLCFNDWRRNPKTDLGRIKGNFFWMNWYQTNRGLVPAIDLSVVGEPLDGQSPEIATRVAEAVIQQSQALNDEINQLFTGGK